MKQPTSVSALLRANLGREQRQAVIVAIAWISLNAGVVAFLMLMVALQHS